MPALYANFAASALAEPLGAADVSLLLAPGDGQLFPAPDASRGERFHCVLAATQSGGQEIVKVTRREADRLTIERGQEGTLPRSFAVGDPVELRLTAETMRGLASFEDLDAGREAIIKNVRHVSAAAHIIDHGDPAAPGSLAWVLAQAGASPCDVSLPGGRTYRVSRNLTIPASARLSFGRAAILNVDAGVTLTLGCEVRAGLSAIFAGLGQIVGPSNGVGGAALGTGGREGGFVLPQWFGARGDGVSDDSDGLAKAFAFPETRLPPGVYLVTRPIALGPGRKATGLAWPPAYVDWLTDHEKFLPGHAFKTAIIQYPQGQHGALLTLGDGASLENLVLRCGQARTVADKLWTAPASHLRVKECLFENLAEVFVDTTGGVPFGAIRMTDSFMVSCGKGFYGALVDCRVRGNLFTSNGFCFELTSGAGFNQIQDNRFEWNDLGISANQARSSTVSGNVFDACKEAAIRLTSAADFQITGNLFFRNGRENASVGKRCHVHVKDQSANTLVTGNVFLKGQPDNESQAVWPKFVIEVEAAARGSVVLRANDLAQGCVQYPVEDPWWSSPESVDLDEYHLRGLGNPNQTDDKLVEILKRLAFTAHGMVTVHLYENRRFTAYTDIVPGRIALVGHGQPVLSDGTGQSHSLVSLRGLTYGQAYSAQPTGEGMAADTSPSLGFWRRGSVVWNAAPTAGGVAGWVCVAEGAPGTWKAFAGIAA